MKANMRANMISGIKNGGEFVHDTERDDEATAAVKTGVITLLPEQALVICVRRLLA
jgi:F0F1-type ATP synthase epsilon subunit